MITNGMRFAAFLCFILLLLPMNAIPVETSGESAALQARTAGPVWKLANGRVVKAGKSRDVMQGTMSSEHVVEAEAITEDPACSFPKGIFRISLTAFLPNRDMPGQKKGRWYVRGDWTITDINTPPDALKARYSPHLLRGMLTAETSFNPVTGKGMIAGKILLQRAGRERRGVTERGNFNGNELFEGTLIMPDRH